jgi:TRAP-type mannitol/chloroaromatic compound transport system substrate-binding protein
MGLARDVVRGLGAEPVALPAAALASGFAAGSVDAAEAGGAVSSQALGILTHAGHATGATINRGGTALSLGFSRSLWDAMSAGDRAIVSAICSAELHTAIAEEQAHRQLLLAPLRQRRLKEGAPRDIASAVSRVSDAVVAHLAATDAATQRINASYTAFRRAIGLKPVVLSA